MAIDYCNKSEFQRLDGLLEVEKDLDLEALYKYLCPVLIFVCFISIIFNAILISLSRRSKSVKKTSILLLSLNLALTDLVASLLNGIGLLFNSYLPAVFNLQFDSTGKCCMLMLEMVRCTALVASALHLLALALVHYRGIVNPLEYRSSVFFSQHLSRTINMISIVCWIVPLTIMMAFSFSPCQGFQTANCDHLFLLSFRFRYTVFALFALPLLLMSAIYLRIFIIISQLQKGQLSNHIERSTMTSGAVLAVATAAATTSVDLPELLRPDSAPDSAPDTAPDGRLAAALGQCPACAGSPRAGQLAASGVSSGGRAAPQQSCHSRDKEGASAGRRPPDSPLDAGQFQSELSSSSVQTVVAAGSRAEAGGPEKRAANLMDIIATYSERSKLLPSSWSRGVARPDGVASGRPPCTCDSARAQSRLSRANTLAAPHAAPVAANPARGLTEASSEELVGGQRTILRAVSLVEEQSGRARRPLQTYLRRQVAGLQRAPSTGASVVSTNENSNSHHHVPVSRKHLHASALPPNNAKALVTTLLILGTYFVSYAPAVVYLVLTCVDDCPFPLYTLPFSRRVLFASMTTPLLIAKSIIDPLIYSYRMKEIQEAVSRYLSKRRPRQSSSLNSKMFTSQRANNNNNNNNKTALMSQQHKRRTSIRVEQASPSAAEASQTMASNNSSSFRLFSSQNGLKKLQQSAGEQQRQSSAQCDTSESANVIRLLESAADTRSPQESACMKRNTQQTSQEVVALLTESCCSNANPAATTTTRIAACATRSQG